MFVDVFLKCVGERNIFQIVLLSFFFLSVFIFPMPSKVIIIVIQLMFLGKNIFRVLLRAHFNTRPTAWAKMSLSRAQNIFMSANINSIVLLSFPYYLWKTSDTLRLSCLLLNDCSLLSFVYQNNTLLCVAFEWLKC